MWCIGHIAYISKINYTILSKGLTITEGVPHLLKLYQMFTSCYMYSVQNKEEYLLLVLSVEISGI